VEGSAEVERLSAGNLKQTWVDHGRGVRWDDVAVGEGEEFLRRGTQIKNVWVPYGE
jgi:aldehyde dehydrogenase (NAD+)